MRRLVQMAIRGESYGIFPSQNGLVHICDIAQALESVPQRNAKVAQTHRVPWMAIRTESDGILPCLDGLVEVRNISQALKAAQQQKGEGV